MRTLFLLVTIISLSSSKAQVKVLMPESTITEIPALDVKSNSEIGLTLVSKESGYKYKAIRITNGSNVKMGFSSVKINNGDVFVNKSTKKEYDLYESPYDDQVGIAINRET